MTDEMKGSSQQVDLPSVERIQQELARAKSIADFFGKEGIFARLFATTLEQMMEAELSGQLGYEKYEAKGRGSGNSRKGKYKRKIGSSGGSVEVAVRRDRNGTIVPDCCTNTKRRAMSEKIRSSGGSRAEPPAGDGLPAHLSGLPVREPAPRDGRIEKVAIYVVLGVGLDGRKDVFGHWVGDGAEGTKFWLTVLNELKARGVGDILIACVDGLNGFKDAIHAAFPQTRVQRCILHQIRNSLKYVTYTEQDDFMRDLKPIYKAATRDAAETALLHLSEKWGTQYAVAVRAWEANWPELSAFFDFPFEIRRLIYTNNAIEGCNRQLRKVTKNKTVFPTDEAVRKAFFLAHRDIAAKWTLPIPNWAKILNQLVIYFDGRIQL